MTSLGKKRKTLLIDTTTSKEKRSVTVRLIVAARWRKKLDPDLFFSRCLLPKEERGRTEAKLPVDIVRTGSWEGII